MKFVILGTPFAKQGDRSRIIKKKDGGMFVHHYKDTKIKEMETNLRAQIVAQLPDDFIPFDKPIVVKNVLFVFPPTASLKKSEKNKIDKGEEIFKSTKPDLMDNLMKGLFDSMQGIVFTNDSRVCEIIHSAKVYGNKPRIELEIEEIPEEEPETKKKVKNGKN